MDNAKHEEIVEWVSQYTKTDYIRNDAGFTSIGVCLSSVFTFEDAKEISHLSPYDMYFGCRNGEAGDIVYMHFGIFNEINPPEPRFIQQYGLRPMTLVSPYIDTSSKGKNIYGFSNTIPSGMSYYFKDGLPNTKMQIDDKTAEIIYANKIAWGMSANAELDQRTWRLAPEDEIMISLLR